MPISKASTNAQIVMPPGQSEMHKQANVNVIPRIMISHQEGRESLGVTHRRYKGSAIPGLRQTSNGGKHQRAYGRTSWIRFHQLRVNIRWFSQASLEMYHDRFREVKDSMRDSSGNTQEGKTVRHGKRYARKYTYQPLRSTRISRLTKDRLDCRHGMRRDQGHLQLH